MSEVVLAPIVGVSPAIKRAVHLVERFAPTTLPILLVGATGTGKELFARHIHYVSRRAGELIDVNCGALPQEIADSLLFGHRRGAFTGAVDSVEGHLERADRGTLFLDEVLHLSPAAQVKLLRALETMEVQRVGDRVKHRVDFRVVSAAHEDTRQRLDAGMFRHDLFQRLAGIVIELPLLVDRPDDIVLLAEHFAAARGQRLEPDSAAVLQNYEWPGNVRELRLAIERAGYLVDNGTLPPGALRDGIELGKPRGAEVQWQSVERRIPGTDRRRSNEPRRSTDELIALCRRCHYHARLLADHWPEAHRDIREAQTGGYLSSRAQTI